MVENDDDDDDDDAAPPPPIAERDEAVVRRCFRLSVRRAMVAVVYFSKVGRS